MKERFDQPGYGIYKNLQDIIIKSIKKESYDDNFNVITSLYQSDINPDQLRVHLDTLSANFPVENKDAITIFDVKDYVLSLSSNERLIISEVCVLLRLILVMPSTNAISERSFSALRRIKTYLRSTMSQDRLNYLLVLHVHKELTDSLDLITVANDFAADSEHRLSIFRRFTESDCFSGGFCFKCKSSLKCEVCFK